MVKHLHLTQKNLCTFTTLLFNHYDNVQKLKNFAQNISKFSQISHLRGNTDAKV